MPYITKKDRKELEKQDTMAATPGSLNYVITKLCLGYLQLLGESYQVYNDIIGVLECCKLEMYRRKVALYEDKKIQQNGDVY